MNAVYEVSTSGDSAQQARTSLVREVIAVLRPTAVIKPPTDRPFSVAAFPGTLEQKRAARQKAMAIGLQRLASRHNARLREPLRIDARGDFSLVLARPWDRPSRGFGEAFAAILNKHNPRVGTLPDAVLTADSCWCYMNHFDVENLLTENERAQSAEPNAEGEAHS